MFEWLFTVEGWMSLLTLTILEIVLGIDNLVFLSIASQKLPPHQRPVAQKTGLLGALVLRILMLALLVWITKLVYPVISIGSFDLSWRDIILIGGGAFLIYKSTHEIHGSLEGEEDEVGRRIAANFFAVVAQIAFLDIIFSLDSVITAVGMAEHVWIMVTAIVIAMIIMLVAAGPVAGFVERHPTVKMLALSFLLLIGTALIADGFGFHIPKGYIYAAMGFSILVEALNLLARRRKAKPVHLRQPYATEDGQPKLPE